VNKIVIDIYTDMNKLVIVRNKKGFFEMEHDQVPVKVGKWMENFVVNDCILPANTELQLIVSEGEKIYKIQDNEKRSEVIFTHYIDDDNEWSYVSFKEGMFTRS
jgi:hypothetical protein